MSERVNEPEDEAPLVTPTKQPSRLLRNLRTLRTLFAVAAFSVVDPFAIDPAAKQSAHSFERQISGMSKDEIINNMLSWEKKISSFLDTAGPRDKWTNLQKAEYENLKLFYQQAILMFDTWKLERAVRESQATLAQLENQEI